VFGAIAKSGMQFLASALPATVLDDSGRSPPEAPIERRRAHCECAADELCSEIVSPCRDLDATGDDVRQRGDSLGIDSA
jgi:hypothetical protein